MKLYSIKSGDEIYYAVAESYGEADEKFRSERLPNEPEKITLLADAQHLILPAGKP
jgi:hypothetical protein